MDFILHQYMPRDRKENDVRLVCEIRPQKTETHRTRLNVGGSLVAYPREFITPTVDLNTVKMHVNSVISEIIYRYMFMDVKYVYLNN